jgi:outer membrane protein assembly factor BamC
MTMRSPLILAIIAVALAGCSFMQGKDIDYKSSGKVPTLEAPPDLLLPAADNRYVVPETAGQGSATYSAYNQERGTRPATGATQVLPKVEKAKVERAGNQRWLVVDLPAEAVWPVVKDFWQGLGFIVNIEQPEAGVMETDWAENRAKIPQDALRNLLGKVIDGLYSTAERDKFRTRLEPAADGKSTEIYISHRGMFEVFEGTQSGADQGSGKTVWQPRASDPELEAEMLRRLMVRFGVEEARAQSQLASKAAPPRAALVKSADGAPGLRLPEAFDRAWRRVGLALDRVGFTVEDRDRVKGIYFVRYADPEAGQKSEGFLSRLAFWGDDKALVQQKYRVSVSARGEQASEVAVYLEDGRPAANETGNRIAALLHEQLK